jgi:hypothetical protein
MTSRTFASSAGSVENLKVSRRQGCRPHLRQIRATQTLEMPSWADSSRLDQCVTPSRAGGGSSVASTTATSSTCAGRPGFGRSARPPMPSAAYRFFHAITVGFDTPTRDTISFVPSPSAASSTIRARCASPAGIDGDRSHRASSPRSESGSSTTAFNGIAKPTAKLTYFIHATLGEAMARDQAARHDLASRNEPAPGSQEDSPGRQRAGDQHPGPGPGKAP